MIRLGNLFVYISIICISRTVSIEDGFDCTFDAGLCGWAVDPPWNLATSILVPTIQGGKPHELIHGTPYLVAQGSFGRVPSGNLTSPWMAATSSHGVMNFAYSKYGSSEAEILLESFKSTKTLDTIEASNRDEKWARRTILIPANPKEVWRIIIVLRNIRNGFDIFALDDVTFALPEREDAILTADDAFFKSDPIISFTGFQIHPAMSREIRRSPSNSDSSRDFSFQPNNDRECVVIKCNFEGSACAWTFNNYRLVSGKMVSESEGESLLISEPVLIPKSSQFTIDIFASEMSSTSIYLRSGNEETLAWNQMGPMLPGWNHIKIPLKYSALPTTILVRSNNPKGAFTALTNSDIVDMNGRSLECRSNVPPIRPMHLDEYVRLTALQRLDPADARRLAPSPNSNYPNYLPTRTLASFHSDGYETMQSPASLGYSRNRLSSASLPISPQSVSEAGAYEEVPKSRPSTPNSSILNNAPYFPSLPLPASSFIRSQGITIAPPINRLPFLPVFTTESPLKRLLNSFGAGSNPMMQAHLIDLAKRFGFDKMNIVDAEKRGKALLETLAAGRTGIEGIQGLIEKSSTISSILPSGKDINAALTNRILQSVPSPIDYGRDSRPFVSEHLDYIVQNAYNGYRTHLRPPM